MNIIKPKWNWRTGLNIRPHTDFIVLHHAAAKVCSAEDIDRWHKSNGWSGIGYHFFVRKDGSIYEGRPLYATGSQAQGVNTKSIGICAEGDYSVDIVMPKEQYNSITELLVYLKNRYPTAKKVVGHKEVCATGCPGKYFPLDELKNFYETIGKNGGGLTMTQYNELKNENEALRKEIEKLRNPMIYNYIDENTAKISPDANDALSAAVECGILHGDEKGLNLTYDMVRIHIWNYRLGLYNKK